MKIRHLSLLLAAAVAFSQFALAQEEVAPGVLHVGTIESPEISDSSGISVSKKNKHAFWTHNDSGPDKIFAITREGESLGEWKIEDVDLDNIEDIAPGPGGLYVADIGNDNLDRDEVQVVRIAEPSPMRSGEARPRKIWTLTYPDEPFDAESFFVSRGWGYVIPKDLNNGKVQVYRFRLNRRGKEFELEKMCKLSMDSKPTGAAITPNGKRLAVITGNGPYLFTFTKTIPTDGTVRPEVFVPFDHQSMEGCTFTADGLVVTSESRDLFLFTDPAFQLPLKGQRRR